MPDSIWARLVLTQHDPKSPAYIHKHGYTVGADLQRICGATEVVGFVAVANWTQEESLAGKKIVTLNTDYDTYFGQHTFFGWTTMKDLSYDDELKSSFDIWRIAWLNA